MKRTINTTALFAACIASVATYTSVAQAESGYPSRPITIVIGSTPGSATDGLTRAVSAEITKATSQPVVVDNRAGAFGGIAAQYVANAKPDGYTLFMTTNTTQSANPHLLKKIAYDPIKDFSPIALLARGNLLLVTNPKLNVSNVAELVELAKASPGKLNYGSGSSSARVATELFQQATGTEFNYIPYKANPPAVLDLVGGQIDLMIVDLTTSLPQVKAGKLNALGISSAARTSLAPDVPTIQETLPGYEFGYWNALYAPAGTPPEAVNAMGELIRQALQTESVKQAIEQTGQEATFMDAQQLSAFQNQELVRWGEIIQAAGIEPE